jgi:glutamine amidotransferase
MARVEPIWHDPDLPDILGAIRSPRILAALRNATPGLPVERAAVLPLVQGDRALVLNGFVPEFRASHMRALREPLRDAWYGRLKGSGDAETLFLRFLQRLEDGMEPGAALVEVDRAVAARLDEGDPAPMTMVTQGPEGITVLHTAHNAPVNSLYLGRGVDLAPGGILLASEPLTADGGWSPVAGHSLLRIGDHGVSVEAL